MAGQSIVIKRNPLEGSPACCGVCGDVCEPKPFDLFIEDTAIPVCWGCATEAAPELLGVLLGRPWWLVPELWAANQAQADRGDPEQ